MMKRKLSAILSVLLIMTLFLALAAPVASADAATDALAAEVLVLVNAERAKAGLAPLSGSNAALNNAALKRAQEIVTNFSHTRPNGKAASTVCAEYGVTWSIFGENIARGQADAEAVMNGEFGWMNSEGHRDNIMNESFTHIGIGVYESGGRLHWVQLFIKEKTGTTPPPAPTHFWDDWPSWLQFILRYVLFGWIWMG